MPAMPHIFSKLPQTERPADPALDVRALDGCAVDVRAEDGVERPVDHARILSQGRKDAEGSRRLPGDLACAGTGTSHAPSPSKCCRHQVSSSEPHPVDCGLVQGLRCYWGARLAAAHVGPPSWPEECERCSMGQESASELPSVWRCSCPLQPTCGPNRQQFRLK